MSSRMFQNNGFLSILLMLFISFLFLLTIPGALCGNIAVNHVTYLSGPVSSPSQFGYSVVVQPQEEFLTFWVGAPKYSHGDSKSGSSGKPGALFRCVANKSAIKLSGNQPLNCLPIGLDSFENGKNNDQQTLSNSTAMSLDLNNCSFKNNDCQGFDILDYDDLRWRKTKRSGSSIPADKTKCIPKRHLPSNYRNRKSLRLTGPAQFTIDGPYLNVDSTKATIEGRVLHTELVSPLIEARKGYARCLRFCFNAYTVVLNAKRQLEVFVQYESANGSKIDDIKHTVFRFDSLKEKWSRLWNYTERNIVGLHDSTYRIYFKATVYPYAYPRNSCNYGAADIALSDIAITTSSCEEEVSNVDEITDEESIGMNLEYKTENKDMLSLASCGPLWQQNCGYSKEADGACYELLVNATHVMNMTSHKPLVRECIRGKMDIVLVVDQSGSVNHCNFQKVKRWLENIVRSFNIGENEQDIGVIVYSSTEKTNVVIPLGFNTHQVSGSNKKEETTKLLKKLSYAAGSTFTGYALKIANEELSRGRRDAKKVMILLTDGATTKENKNQLNEETAIARRRNTTILAIGVGRSNKTELVGIAGSENNIFSVRKFSELEKVRDSLRSSLKFETNEEGIKGENHSSSWPRQCQLGFSVHYTQKSMLMGSPGCYHRSGSVISYQSDPYTENEEKGSDSTFFNQSSQATTINPSSDVLSSTSAELNEARDLSKLSKLSNYDVPTLSQLQNLFSTEIFDSYIGYALTSGHFYGMDNPEYVAVSAPRYNMKGAVLIYHSLQGSAFKYHHLLNGQQLGEYFGATLCVTDLNADGFSDLLVGAPLHIGSHPDEGRVYVYLGGPKMSNEPDFVLTGSTSPFSRFGSYISAVGDLNNDNYNDIAVSAPLLGSGSVYIFYGSKDGIIPKHVQVINPTELYPLPDFVAKKFGKKVVGKVDIDNNSYPDLIVSSPENDALVVLLSRSVVNIDLQLHVPSEIDVQNDACRNYRSCFDISVCFSYNGSSIPSDIFIEFNLKVDFSQHQPRFTSSQNSSLSNVCSIIKLLSRNNFYCQNFPFVLKRRTRDLMSAISVTVEYDLKNDHPSSETDAVSEEDSASSYDYFSASGSPDNDVQEAVEDKFKLHPILSLNSVSTLEKVVYIQSYCNKLDECNADLVVNANVVNNFGEKVSEMSIDFEKIIRLRINVKNHGPEAAYDPAIIIYYSKFLFINSWKNIYSNLDNNEVI